MLWKKDRLRPTQPYFVLNSKSFQQEIYLQQGISHFYTFEIAEPQALTVVPDACIDLFFEYTDQGMSAWVCGTVLRFQSREWGGNRSVFGVRFMPGVQPALIRAEMSDLVGKRIPLESVLRDKALIAQMAEQQDFKERIRVFLQEYTRQEDQAAPFNEKKELVWSVKRIVYETDGKVKISHLPEKTGYSERYINRVFLQEMGFSPKTFCKIIQFQRALEFLNYGAPDKMTDAAIYLGYYDQPQFIRDFKTYCGVTPLTYLRMIGQRSYQSHISETGVLP